MTAPHSDRVLSLNDAAARLDQARKAYLRCPESSAAEPRLYREYQDATVAYLRAELADVKAQLVTVKASARALDAARRRELEAQQKKTERLLASAKDAATRPRTRRADGAPLLDRVFGEADECPSRKSKETEE